MQPVPAGESSRAAATAGPAVGVATSLSQHPPKLERLELSSSPSGSHRKQSSISSVGSNGSKTAAFFASSPEATLPYSLSRNASISSTAGNGIDRSNRGSGYLHDGKKPSFDSLLPVSPTHMEHGASLDRGASWSSSSSARRWVDFEGRAVSPLPSPYEGDEQMPDYNFPKRRLSSNDDQLVDSPIREHVLRGGAFGITSPTASSPSHLSASSSLTTIPVETGTKNFACSPKTMNFFTNDGAPQPSPKQTAESLGMPQLSSQPSKRRPSSVSHLDTPIRLPSLVSEPPSPSLSQYLDQTSMLTPHPPSGAYNEQARSYVLLGSQPIHPAAFVSPPSPDPQDKDEAQGRAETAFAAAKASRHVHGPSENATNSSMLPSIHVMKENSRRIREESPGYNHQIQPKVALHSDHLTSPSKHTLPLLVAEDTEDEATGRVGGYRVDRVLGLGAFSRVVLARRLPRRQATATPGDPSGNYSNSGPIGNVMALKMLEREPCKHNERMRVSWVREVEVLKHVVHPNIVRFMSAFSTQKHHVLVLESVNGGELFDYLASDQAEIAQREWLVRRIFGELANAVGWMHSINLVHRDIKLENILLTQNPRALQPLTPAALPTGPLVKVSDFGLSRFVDPASPILETRCGSEEYAAPELVMGKRYDGRKTDVWALGVVLYALLTGSLPFLPPDDWTSPTEGYDAVDSSSVAHVTRETSSTSVGQTGHEQGRVPDARARKAHLLRIAKCDLRWPSLINEECRDKVSLPQCAPLHRLITPSARLVVAKLLRRDSDKRVAAWDVWNEPWMLHGSIPAEASAFGQPVSTPLDPRSPQGQAWLATHARIHSGASDVVLDD